MRKKGAAKEKSWKLAVGLIAAAVLCAAVALFIWEQQPEYFTYRDQQLEAIKGVDRNRYDPQAFTQEENGWITYEKNGRKALTGIDVSVYQGDIDWEAVAQSGVEFAIIRLGYRGYSQGAIQLDRNFEQNMWGALEAGLDVGVYFFSQATTVLEAEEEADFVLENLRGYPITFPVVFDWEFVTADQARTHEMEGEALTDCALAFCELVATAGYTPMVYFNQDIGYFYYQLDELDQYPFWLAEYDSKPDFFYDFEIWQYTHTGTVPGIQGSVDLNLAFESGEQMNW